MGKIKKSAIFFKEAIIFFGFLQGFWVAIGIRPLDIVSGILYPFVERLGSFVLFVFGLLPIALLGFGLYLVYKKGRLIGIIAVLLGFIAGTMILVSPYLSGLLLMVAGGVGFLAVR